MPDLNVLSLFTGAGGLDLGLEASGLCIAGCVENDPDCRKTIRANTAWALSEQGDVLTVGSSELLAEFGLVEGEVDVLAGGPPCQPFSKSGQWVTGQTQRMSDPRARTLRRFFEVAEAALPRAVILENVKGLISEERLDDGVEPASNVVRAAFAEINGRHGTNYMPAIVQLDAADYGVPQHRERIFVVAARDGRSFAAPPRTHGGPGQPRRAVAWDALADLDVTEWDPSLAPRGVWAELLPTIPEGANYLHHTDRGEGEPLFGWRRRYWSFLLKLAKNRPSWTIQAQAGPATGPFHWKSRKLSVREAARLQTFPDRHAFSGSEPSARRQVGNAVPVALGELLGLEIQRQFFDLETRPSIKSLPRQRGDCPPPEPIASVPDIYLSLRGHHDAHPGTGNGPRAQQRVSEAR